MKHKKAASNIIVTIVLILVVILAIAIIARFIIPFIRNSINSSSVDININLANVEAYYNNQPITSNILNANENKETVFVKVQRSGGQGATNISSLKFIFTDFNGYTKTCIRKFVPSELESYIYSFKSSIFSQAPRNIEIIPMTFVNEKERPSKITFNIRVFNSTNNFAETVNECNGFCCNSDENNLPSDEVPQP